jgi:hypothetical protein
MTTDTPTDTPRTDAVMTSANWPYHITSQMQKIERELAASQAECAQWRKVAESLAHKNNMKLDQRKFAKQDWWDKKLANDK